MSAPRSFTKRCVALILIATLSIGAVSASVNPVLVLYLRQYQQFTGRELTVALTGFNVAGMVVSLALGRWVDISGRGIQTFLGVSAASAVCYMMLPLTHSYPTTLAVLLTVGGPSLALISLLFTLLRRAGLGDRILMYARAAFSLSWVIGPAVSPFIIQTLGYPALFWFAAALCVTGSVALIAPLYLAASSPAAPPGESLPLPPLQASPR